jgi:large subunit ribosomal protein L28
MASCSLTGKRWMNGHKISHSNIKTPKRFGATIQKKRIFDVDSGRWVKVTISMRALKTLNKMSLSQFVRR